MVLKNELDTSRTRLLLFDIDDTVTRWTSVPLFLESVLNEYGIPYSDDVMKGFFQAVTDFDMHLVTTMECDLAVYDYLLGFRIPILREYGVRGTDFRKSMFSKEAEFTFVNDGVRDSLTKLQKDYIMFAYTNWFLRQAKKKLAKHNLEDYFKFIYAYDNNYIKFSKVGFLIILEDLGLSNREVIHIGDGQSDISASKSAGVQSILVDYDQNKPSELYDKASAVVTDFQDIPMILNRKLK